MTEYREEVVETTVDPAPGPTRMVEERTVNANGSVSRVVHTTTDVPSSFPVAAEAARRGAQPRRTVRRWWRRSTAPTMSVDTTEYTNAPAYGEEPSLAQFLRLSWFLLGLVEALLGLRFLLALLGANAANSFAALVYGVTWPFVAPFRTLFATPSAGNAVFEGYTLIAMLVIFVAWWVCVRFLGVLLNRSVDV